MADENLIDEEGKIDDADWAAAMAEQTASEQASAQTSAAQMDEEIADDEIDWAAAMAEQAATESAKSTPTAGAQANTAPHAAQIFPSFETPQNASGLMNELDLILDIPVQITVELGRTKISIKNLLQLAHGSVVELDAMAGEPMDVLVNGTLIAQGEVVVVNDKFGIRLTDIVSSAERMRKLHR